MKITLILSALLICASALNAADNSALTMPPTSDLPLPPLQNNTTQPKSQTRSQKAEQQRDAQRQQSKSSRSSGYSGSSGRSQQQNAQNMRPVMPTAPTDSSAGSRVGQAYNFLPPTADAGSVASDPNGGYAGLPDRMNVPTSPTRARPGEAQSYSSMHSAEEQNRRVAASRNAASSQAQMTPKAFSNVTQQSSSGSSPYMNLFRTGNNNGTIDNYTTLVKPQLDQQGTNQKFGADIHGLENSTHVQGLNIRQLNRETQTLQGVNATQYFMNYGDYYQGAR
jgi:hypothetical protein